MRQMTLDQIDLEGNGFHEALNAFIISHTMESPGRAEPSNFRLISSARRTDCAAEKPKSFPTMQCCVSPRSPSPALFSFDMQTKSALDFGRRNATEYLRELMTILSVRKQCSQYGRINHTHNNEGGAPARESQVSVPNEYSPCAATPLPPGAPRKCSTK